MQKIYNAIEIYGDHPKRQNKPRSMLSYTHGTNQKYIQHGQLTQANYTENKSSKAHSRSRHVSGNGKGRNGTEQLLKPGYDGESSSKSEVTSKIELRDNIGFIVEPLSMERLKPRIWFNDEIIDFFMKLVEMYSVAGVNAKCLTTKFMTKLLENGYNYMLVKNWMKTDVSRCDVILCPINMADEGHWTLAAIYRSRKIIQYYDSLGSCGKKYLEALERYLWDEGDKTRWKLSQVEINVPIQRNSYDCGVFVCISSFWILVIGKTPSYDQSYITNSARIFIRDSITTQQLSQASIHAPNIWGINRTRTNGTHQTK